MDLPTIFYGKKLCLTEQEHTEQLRDAHLKRLPLKRSLKHHMLGTHINTSEEIHRALDNCNHAATRGCIYRGRSRH